MKTLEIRAYRKVDELRRREIATAVKQWAIMLAIMLFVALVIANTSLTFENPYSQQTQERRPY